MRSAVMRALLGLELRHEAAASPVLVLQEEYVSQLQRPHLLLVSHGRPGLLERHPRLPRLLLWLLPETDFRIGLPERLLDEWQPNVLPDGLGEGGAGDLWRCGPIARDDHLAS